MHRIIVVTEHPTIGRRWCACLLAGVLGIGSGGPAWSAPIDKQGLQAPDRTVVADPAKQIAEFRLVDQDGHTFGSDSLQGRTVLMFFGFTNCPNVCPPTMQRILQVQRTLDSAAKGLMAVFISVDGARDTPERMKEYLRPFSPGFVGLTGDPGRVKELATGLSAIFFKGLPTDNAGGYNVEHSSQVYLVDRDGRLRATFYNAPTDDMAKITAQVLAERS